MAKIIYFSRNSKAGFSIQKVFNEIISNSNNLNNKLYEVPFYRANISALIKNIKFVYNKREKNKIHHITGDIHYCILALIGVKSVLTVHDLVLLNKTGNKFKKAIYFIFWYYLPIKLATKVVCISEKTKQDVLKYINRKDIEIITNPVSKEFKKNNKLFNKNKPIVLHIGTGWNKNLFNVIKALENINCHLRIVGKIKEKELKLLQTSNINYSNVYQISDAEIIEEYKNADIISFPSFFEGFGMPIIEGQATGRAVLTSNLSPMKDIGKDSVELINPQSIESIKKGFYKLFENDLYRETLINRGFYNVEKYKIENVVKAYKNLYEKISN